MKLQQSYLDATDLGQNEWWRYVMGITLILTVWMTGSIMLLTTLLETGLAIQTEAQFEIIDPLLNYIVIHLPFGFWLLGLWLVMTLVHRRSLLTLISYQASIQYLRVLKSLGVWFILMVVPVLLALLQDPDWLRFTSHGSEWFKFLGFIVLLTPIQTTTEELFFRGYVIQGLGLLTRKTWLLCSISSFIFLVPHLGNPELSYGWLPLTLFYLCFGYLTAWITLKDDRLELAIGLHAANNLFPALLITYENATLETPALLTVDQVDATAIVLNFLIRAVAFGYLWFGLTRSSDKLTD